MSDTILLLQQESQQVNELMLEEQQHSDPIKPVNLSSQY